MTRGRLLFYCQHSLGLGHLARSLRLAAGLAARFDVLLLNGGRFPAGTTVPPGVAVRSLPPLGHDAGHQLISHDPALSVGEAHDRRRAAILDALDQAAPQVVLVEMYPFGRRKFEVELLPLLDAVAGRGPARPRVVCSLRDILVGRRRDQSDHDERCCLRANSSFDAILVHADPTFARLEDSFRPATPLRVPVHYTGFVAPPAPAVLEGPAAARAHRLLVSSGGGMVGEPLVRAAVGVHRELAARAGLTTTVVAGPFLPEPAWAWLQDQAARSPCLEAVRRVDDLCAEMRRSTVSLSQGGYNTTMDILRAETSAVVVPYSAGGEDEQSRRTERLAALAAVRMIPAAELTAARLLRELCTAATRRPAPVPLDLSGQDTAAEIVAGIAGLSADEPVSSGRAR